MCFVLFHLLFELVRKLSIQRVDDARADFDFWMLQQVVATATAGSCPSDQYSVQAWSAHAVGQTQQRENGAGVK